MLIGHPSVNCPYCGQIHERVCPLIQTMEYHPDGSLKKVTFFPTRLDFQTSTPLPLLPDPITGWKVT